MLAPGGRVGITVWGHIKQSPGAWALRPFTLASPPKVANQAAMVALGRPGAGEALLADAGFVDIERVEIPFAWEFADPESYARALASTGPAYEAIQAVGEEAFVQSAIDVAAERVRDGLPLRAAIAVVGYVARKPGRGARRGGHRVPRRAPSTDGGPSALYDEDVEELGYVMNASRLWAHQPGAQGGLFGLLKDAVGAGALTFRQRGILVRGVRVDARRLLLLAGVGRQAGRRRRCRPRRRRAAGRRCRARRHRAGAGPLGPPGHPRSQRDRRRRRRRAACRRVRRRADLRHHVFVALRIAFSTVNDALGARPDRELSTSVPDAVRDAVTFGRPAVS